jgi:hypothetical protein
VRHVPFGSIQAKLAASRIFFLGRGVTTVEATGNFFEPTALVAVPDALVLEPYTTFWGQSGRALATMGSFSYTHSRLAGVASVGRYSSIAKGMTVMGRSHPLEWISTSPVFYNRAVMMRTFLEDVSEEMTPH